MPSRLLKKLRAIRRRLQWIDFCVKFLAVLKWAGLLLLLFLVFSRLFPLPVGLEIASRWAAGVAAAILLAWCLLRPVRLFGAAVRADEQLGLKERLSSALAIGDPKTEPERAVLDDAARHAEAIQPHKAFRLQLRDELQWAVGPLFALALVWALMPQFDLLAREKSEEDNSLVKAVEIETQKEAAKRLEELAEKINKNAASRKPVLANGIEKELNALAKKISEHKITPQKAMAKVSNMKDRINARQMEIEKKLEMPNSMQSKGMGKHTKEIGKALEKGNFDKAAKLLQDLKKKLQDGSLSDREKASLQKEMEMMAKQLGLKSPIGKALSQAAGKMSEGKMNSALADMEMAAGEMLDMQAMLQELQALDSIEVDMDARKLALASKGELCDDCKAGGT